MKESNIKISPKLTNLGTDFIGNNIIYRLSVSSTMDIARQAVKEGAMEGTVVIADEQTAGRGRRGRYWLSPQGNIALSIILYPSLTLLPSLIMVSSLAVVHAIEEVTPLRPSIKWPNDILINNKKVGGILIESEIEAGEVKFALVGIGVNVNARPGPFPSNPIIATSLFTELKREVTGPELLTSLLYQFEQLYLTVREGESLRLEWLNYLETLGKRVQVKMGETIKQGYAESVNDEGHLLLRCPDGKLIPIAAGDITAFSQL